MAEIPLKTFIPVFNISIEKVYMDVNADEFNPRKAKSINERQLLTNNGTFLNNADWLGLVPGWYEVNPIHNYGKKNATYSPR